GSRQDGHCGGFDRAEMARQIEPHRRALAGLAVDRAMPARLLDKAVDLRQPQTRALARFFCCEKRPRHPFPHPGGPVRAAVAVPWPVSFVVKNGSNALSRTSAVMPLPVSLTEIATYCPGATSSCPAA